MDDEPDPNIVNQRACGPQPSDYVRGASSGAAPALACEPLCCNASAPRVAPRHQLAQRRARAAVSNARNSPSETFRQRRDRAHRLSPTADPLYRRRECPDARRPDGRPPGRSVTPARPATYRLRPPRISSVVISLLWQLTIIAGEQVGQLIKACGFVNFIRRQWDSLRAPYNLSQPDARIGSDPASREESAGVAESVFRCPREHLEHG